MNYKKYYYIIFFLLTPLSMMGQVKQYQLKGQIRIKNGKTYPYQITLNIKGNTVTGTSATKLDDGSEPKTRITGTINKAQKTLSFSENTMGGGQQGLISCFVTATLALKKTGNTYVLKGDFKGRDYDFMYCAEGNIEMGASAGLNELFNIDTTKLLAKTKQITAEQQKQERAKQAHIRQNQANAENSDANTTKEQSTGKEHTDNREHPDREQTMETSEVSERESIYEITAGVVKQFEWRTDSCIIELFDGGVIDGDEITLVFNDDEILQRYTLTKKRKRMSLYLSKKVNTISIIADKEGYIPPNTADIVLYDGHTRYRIEAYNNIGESATIKIYTAR